MRQFLDEALEGMRQHFGLKAIDAVVITHMHGDHFLEAPYLRENGAPRSGGSDRMAGRLRAPRAIRLRRARSRPTGK